MVGVLVLATWMAAGVTIAAVTAPHAGARFEWAPIAAILGPLWMGIVLDRRHHEAETRRGRDGHIDLRRSADAQSQVLSS